jgi:5'-nucleotidase/UDP-sugar diphosphatase
MTCELSRKSRKLSFIYLMVFLVIISVFSYAGAANPVTTELVILHTNDTHGHPLNFFENPAPEVGGLAARATLVKQIRSQAPNVILLDAGDINTGRPESNFFNGTPDILGYNYLKYDAVALGNHEFDDSLKVLAVQMKQAKFPFLAANVKNKVGQYIAQPYIIRKYKGFKVAVFGLTTKTSEFLATPDLVKDLIFEDEVAAAKALVPELRKKADVVIALVHLGIDPTDETGSRRLAKMVPGIDLIVDGHSHTYLKEPLYINNIPIVQAKQWGLYLGKGVMTIENKKVTGFKWELVPVNIREKVKKADGSTELKYIGQKIEEDQTLLGLLKPYGDKVNQLLSEVIGFADALFPQANVRKEETALGNLVADSMLWQTKGLGTDFAIQNGGGIRADLPAGPITKKTIYEILPFDNSVAVVSIKGKDLIPMFDFIAATPGKGAFPQVSEGVGFTINTTTGKCQDILINGKPVDPEKIYRIATNSFMAAGGDGYQAFTKAIDLYDTSVFQRDTCIEYIIQLGGKVKPELKNRIKFIQDVPVSQIRKMFQRKAA